MLKPLRDDLRHWRPSGRSLSPIDAIRTAWASIVGVETARHCTPAEIKETTLVVMTRSGSWSQQLGYLESRILEGIAGVVAAGVVTGLRFRVGKLQTMTGGAASAKQGHAQSRLRLAVPLEPAETLAELCERMRLHVARHAHLRGPRCSGCRIPLPAAGMCAPCRSREREQRMVTILRTLGDMPWLTDAQVAEHVGRVDVRDCVRARQMLATRWFAQLERLRRRKTFERGEPERATAVAYVMLQSGITPDRLTPTVARYVLGPQLDDLLYPI